MFCKKGKQYFQFKYKLIQTSHYKEVISTEPFPLVRVPWSLGEIKYWHNLMNNGFTTSLKNIICCSFKTLQLALAMHNGYFYAYTRISMNILGSLRIYQYLYAYTSISMHILVSLYIEKDLYAYTRISMHILGFLCIYQDLYAYTRISMHIIGSLCELPTH